jgi:cell wall-associated NlpC family hydrolase
MRPALAIAISVLALFPLSLVVLLGLGASEACTQDQGTATAVRLDGGQARNARTVVGVGQRLGLPSRGLVVAVAAALQESDLRNLGYGDRDSLGLFQQRPSQGWGSPAQILDPRYAATSFYTALLAVPDWQQLPIAVAAQAVQHSAFPDAYGRWENEAIRIVAMITDSSEGSPRSVAGCRASASLSSAAVAGVLNFATSQVGDAYVLGANGPDAWDCSSLVRAAVETTGVDLPRTAAEQYDWFRTRGALIPGPARQSWLRPGDVLFSVGANPNVAGDGEPVGHVALYAGRGVVIEAKGHTSGVTSLHYGDTALASVTWVGRLPTSLAAAAPQARSSAGSPALDRISTERSPS